MYLIFWNTKETGEWDEFLGTWSGDIDKSDGEWHTEYIQLAKNMMMGQTVLASVLYEWNGDEQPKVGRVAYIDSAQWEGKKMSTVEETNV